MNTTQLAVDMIVYEKEGGLPRIIKQIDGDCITVTNNYNGVSFFTIDGFHNHFTTTLPLTCKRHDYKNEKGGYSCRVCHGYLGMGEKVLFYISPYYQDRLNVNNGVICKYENVTTPTKSDQNTTTTNGESEIKEIEGRKVIFHFKSTPEMFGLSDKDAEYADMADEYAVVKIPANAGIMIYGKFNDQWKANPSGRFAIRYLLESISQLQSRVKELEGLNEAAEKHIEIITRERDWQTDVVVPDLDQQIAALKQENERLRGLIKGLVNENERIAKLAKVDPIMKCEKPVPCTDGHDVSEGSSTCSKCGERYIHNPTHRPDKR